MSQFEESHWSDNQIVIEFNEYADVIVPFRQDLIELTKSFYSRFVQKQTVTKMLDLGGGDGFFLQQLLEFDQNIEATLVDASAQMITAARKRLAGFENVRFVKADFETLLVRDELGDKYDFVFSSLAIHHLKTIEKKTVLFEYIYTHLKSGGTFVNIDVILAEHKQIDQWYVELWRQWIDSNAQDSKRAQLLQLPKRHNPDNNLNTLSEQLEVLKRIGFKNVECYYKYGLFVVFGGQRNLR